MDNICTYGWSLSVGMESHTDGPERKWLPDVTGGKLRPLVRMDLAGMKVVVGRLFRQGEMARAG